MSRAGRISIVVVLAAAVVAVIILKSDNGAAPTANETSTQGPAQAAQQADESQSKKPNPDKAALPKLIDLGAAKCIPCKMMAPILEELKKEYEGRLKVVFIDVWKEPEAGKPYGIRVIPTQIFFDASGKELYRHVGFLSKEDILNKWKELGVDLGATRTAIRRVPAGQVKPRGKENCTLCRNSSLY